MLDGACDVDKLCERAKELGMPAVAMTDHGNIFGAVHFVNAAKQAGIKPIIGCELYICKKDDHNIERTPPEGDSFILIGLKPIAMGRPVTRVSLPLLESIEKAEMLFDPALPTYRKLPAESMASTVEPYRRRLAYARLR